MKIEIDGQPVEKFAVSEVKDGSRLVTIHLVDRNRVKIEIFVGSYRSNQPKLLN